MLSKSQVKTSAQTHTTPGTTKTRTTEVKVTLLSKSLTTSGLEAAIQLGKCLV